MMIGIETSSCTYMQKQFWNAFVCFTLKKFDEYVNQNKIRVLRFLWDSEFTSVFIGFQSLN